MVMIFGYPVDQPCKLLRSGGDCEEAWPYDSVNEEVW